MMRPLRLYMAGPLFTLGEKFQNSQLTEALRKYGYECFLPQESEANLRAQDAHTIFRNDVNGVDWCDVIVACIDGPDPDSGTCWELGYAYAKSKPAVLYRTDFRTACGDYDGQPVNLMLSAHVPKEAQVIWGMPDNEGEAKGLINWQRLAEAIHMAVYAARSAT